MTGVGSGREVACLTVSEPCESSKGDPSPQFLEVS